MRMKCGVLLGALLCAPTCLLCANGLLTYETTERTRTTIARIETRGPTESVFSTDTDVVYSGPSFSTYKYVYTDPKINARYTAEKKGREILVPGVLNNRGVEKVLAMGDKQWFQCFQLAMMYFVSTGLDAYAFWVLRADTAELCEFKITRGVGETMARNGVPVPVQKLHLGIEGFLSLLWRGLDAWARLSDGVVIRMTTNGIETALVSEEPL